MKKTKPLSLSVFQVGLLRRWYNLGSTLSFSDTFELKWTEKCRFCIKKDQCFTKTTQFWPKKPCFGLKKTKILSFSSCFVCLQRWWCKLGLIQSFSETSKHKYTEKCRFCSKKSQIFSKNSYKKPILAKKTMFWFKKTKILSFFICFVCLQRWWCKLGLILNFSAMSKAKWRKKIQITQKLIRFTWYTELTRLHI